MYFFLGLLNLVYYNWSHKYKHGKHKISILLPKGNLLSDKMFNLNLSLETTEK